MLTKTKRIRRQRFAVGDEPRDFKEIPKASQPVQQKMGKRSLWIGLKFSPL